MCIRDRTDGTLALVPTERVTADIVQLARDAKPAIVELMAALPAPGHCPICGASNGWGAIDGTTTAQCVSCALIAVNRFLEAERYISPEPSPITLNLTRQEQTG